MFCGKNQLFGKAKIKKRVVHAKNVSFMQKMLNNIYKNTMLFIGNFGIFYRGYCNQILFFSNYAF